MHGDKGDKTALGLLCRTLFDHTSSGGTVKVFCDPDRLKACRQGIQTGPLLDAIVIHQRGDIGIRPLFEMALNITTDTTKTDIAAFLPRFTHLGRADENILLRQIRLQDRLNKHLLSLAFDNGDHLDVITHSAGLRRSHSWSRAHRLNTPPAIAHNRPH